MPSKKKNGSHLLIQIASSCTMLKVMSMSMMQMKTKQSCCWCYKFLLRVNCAYKLTLGSDNVVHVGRMARSLCYFCLPLFLYQNNSRNLQIDVYDNCWKSKYYEHLYDRNFLSNYGYETLIWILCWNTDRVRVLEHSLIGSRIWRVLGDLIIPTYGYESLNWILCWNTDRVLEHSLIG